LALLELGYQNWFADNLDIANEQLTKSYSILAAGNNHFMFARVTAVHASIYWTK
jgi:hypothetical protein